MNATARSKASARRCAAQQSRRAWERVAKLRLFAQHGLWGDEPQAKKLWEENKKRILDTARAD